MHTKLEDNIKVLEKKDKGRTLAEGVHWYERLE
jgi:hypothetical protein